MKKAHETMGALTPNDGRRLFEEKRRATVSFAGYSDVGGRETNEDAYCMEENNGSYLFAVADGLGGHDCGEIASTLTIEHLRRRFRENPSGFSLEQAILEANRRIIENGKDTGTAMKTTVCAVYICDGRTLVANVGDSRAYLLYGKDIIFQTMDHSVAQMAVNVGEISADQIRLHEDRSVLTRALGATETVRIDVGDFRTEEFDRILVCSDGFWEYVIENEICGTARLTDNADGWLQKMRESLDRQKTDDRDNNTAITAIKEERMR